MIFFDIDETIFCTTLSQKKAMEIFYNNHSEMHCIKFDDLYPYWLELDQKCFDEYLEGKYDFDTQRKMRFKRIMSKCGCEISKETAWIFFCEYEQKYRQSWCLFDDVLPCFEMLKNERLGIITNGDDKQQNLKLEKLNIKNKFEITVTTKCGFAKPNIKMFEYAADAANISLSDMIYVGDNYDVDIKPCIDNNIKCFHIQRPKNDLMVFANELLGGKYG